MRTLDDFNVIGFDYQAIPQMRVGNLSVGLKFTIYSFHPKLAPPPQIRIIIWLVIVSPSRTAIHAVSSFLPKSLPQELLHLTLTPASLPFIKVQRLPDIAYALLCLCQLNKPKHNLPQSACSPGTIDFPSNAAIVLVTRNN